MSRQVTGFIVAMLLGFAALGAGAATPDFSGTWERFPDPYSDERFPDDPPPPAGGPRLKEPYATAYKKLKERKASADSSGKPIADPATRCVPEGVPTIMAAVHPIEIVQTSKQVVVLAEFLTQTRRIYIGEKMPALEDVSPGYNGYSVARWQGDTLIVQTIGVREDVRFMDFPHSPQMKVTERWRLTAPDRLENQLTVEDPSILARPYVFTFGYKRNPEYRILEYICDNNRYRFDAEGGASLQVTPR